MKEKAPALLITGAIDIEGNNVPFTRISNTQIRLDQYIHSIEYAIKKYRSIDKIIFVENTNFLYDYSSLYHLAVNHKKTLEVLPFKGEIEKTIFHGKGFGEMECINYALRNSKLLKTSTEFIKLTGRVDVLNFDCLLYAAYGANSFYAVRAEKFPYVETILYKVDKVFFQDNMSDLGSLVLDREKMYLERVFYKRLYELRRTYPIGSFRAYRFLKGISASTGNSYGTKMRYKITNSVLAAFGRFDINSH